jgi:hypothetical protein
MYFLEMLIGDMGVDLGGGDRGVSEHRLDAPDIRSIGEEIGSKGVPQRMRVDIFDDAGFGGIVFDDAFDTSRCQAGYFLVPGSEGCKVFGERATKSAGSVSDRLLR